MIDKILALAVFWLPLVVTVIYTAISIAHLFKGSYGLSLMWFCYGMANVGMLYALSHGEGGH